ncbi:hypothetical protein [Streptomyces dysideae]|uniref:Uncharacterized protein n=1 Tax=Streptomyces dysideae TaxID=909626 RepID=A0A101UPE2_9ACTN|nr:hypothetical protein [Streptomyces dysideae]KUO14336.1 hypothetical protein AQJ91_47475 [Streptomyces dysideae]
MEAAFDLGYGGCGCAAQQVHRAEPDVDEGGDPGRAVVLEGVVEGGAEAVLGSIEVAVGESGQAGVGACLAADLGVVLTGGDAVGLGPIRGGGGVVAGGVRHGGSGQVDAAALPGREVGGEAPVGEAGAEAELPRSHQ